MPFEHSKFEIARRSDRQVVEGVMAAIKDTWTISKLTCQSVFGGGGFEGLPGQQPLLDQILAEDSVALVSFTFALNSGVNISIHRDWNHNDRKLQGYHDTVSVQPHRQGDDQRQLVEGARIIKRLRATLHAVDDKDFLDYLKDEDKAYYRAREESLQKLQGIQEGFFKKLHDFGVQQAEEYQKKHEALEKRFAEKEDQLNALHQQRTNDLDAREQELKKRAEDLDDRANTHVRREIRRDLKKVLTERSQKFELTEGTKKRRRGVLIGYVALLAVLGAGAGYFLFGQSTGTGSVDTLLVVRQILFTLAFATTAGFFLRWMSQWAQAHAEEEFKLKRLELDIDRASWVVEHALEWKAEKGNDIPEHLLDRLSKNLFSEEASDEHGMTAADSLALAILRSSAKAKLRVGDAEFEIGSDGVKKLERTRLD